MNNETEEQHLLQEIERIEREEEEKKNDHDVVSNNTTNPEISLSEAIFVPVTEKIEGISKIKASKLIIIFILILIELFEKKTCMKFGATASLRGIPAVELRENISLLDEYLSGLENSFRNGKQDPQKKKDEAEKLIIKSENSTIRCLLTTIGQYFIYLSEYIYDDKAVSEKRRKDILALPCCFSRSRSESSFPLDNYTLAYLYNPDGICAFLSWFDSCKLLSLKL